MAPSDDEASNSNFDASRQGHQRKEINMLTPTTRSNMIANVESKDNNSQELSQENQKLTQNTDNIVDSSNDTYQRCLHDKENPYVMISRDLIRDNSISPTCRWLIIYLLTNTEGFVIKTQHIINHLKGVEYCGRDRVYEYIEEAVSAGYLKKEVNLVRNSKGQVIRQSCKYFVSESPKFKKDIKKDKSEKRYEQIGNLRSEHVGQNPAHDFAPKETINPEIVHNSEKEGKNLRSEHVGQNPVSAAPGLADDKELAIVKDKQEEKEIYKEKIDVQNTKQEIQNATACAFALELFKHIKEIMPKVKNPDLKKWSDTFDLMLRVDKRSPEEIEKVINFLKFNNFWKINILSPEKLRKHFDRLELEMSNPSQDKYKINEESIKYNENIMKDIENTFSEKIQKGDIVILIDGIHFIYGPTNPGDFVNKKDPTPMFLAKVKNNLKKMGLIC